MNKGINPFATRVVYAIILLAHCSVAFGDTVVVRPGDTLALIAERELGDRNRYTEICDINLRALKHDCNYLVIGTVLTLPPRGNTRKVAAPSRSDFSANSPNTIVLTGDFVASFGRFGDDSLNVPEGYDARIANDHVELSGYVADAVAGGKPGVWLQIPASVEKWASGNLILVKVVVRMRRTPGPIALAYSTADVGNSGWIKKTAGTTFRTVSFTYRVPEMNLGNGDYIGILPDPRHAGQVLHVAEIAVELVED